MKKLWDKIKEWATDYPKPSGSLYDLTIHKGPTLSATAQIVEGGLPFHIEWKGERVRHDN